MHEGLLATLAFFWRSTAFIALVLLYCYFRASTGRLVPHVRQVLGAFTFLLAWVSLASVFEVLNWWVHAGQLIEYGTSWIWIPNAVIAIALVRLLGRLLYLRDNDDA